MSVQQAVIYRRKVLRPQESGGQYGGGGFAGNSGAATAYA